MTRPPVWLGLPVLALAVAALALPGSSSASHQPSKNGCTSASPISGELTSPSFSVDPTANGVVLDFETWWEIESSAPASSDQMTVSFSVDGGINWTPLAPLNPSTNPGGAPDLPLSNRGLQARPDWQSLSRLLPGTSSASSIQLRFRFDTVNANFNGFRGWGIDDVILRDAASIPPVVDFEGGLPSGWMPTGFWRHLPNSEPVFMSSAVNPPLVTLAAGDDGRVPPDPNGGFVWFGQASTGTYCGADALAEPPHPPNVAPTAAFNVNPSAPKTSDTVTFDGSPSSDPEGALASHTWDFGDGSPAATGAAASHTYVKAGTYNVTLTVADAQGATSTATHALQVGSNLGDRILVADKLDDLPNPKPFEEVNVEPTEGQVFVQIDGRVSAAQTTGAPRGFIPLTQAAQLPIGSVLETSRGKVLVESSRDRRARRTQRAEFFDGRFSMRQPRVRRGPLTTEMVLKGGSFRGCPRARQSASWSRANDAQRRRRSRVRRLWGNGRGRFRTRGRYSSATVRGTTWLVEDRCDGTLTRLPRRPRTSVVDVRDLVSNRTIRLRAGRSYLARPRATRTR